MIYLVTVPVLATIKVIGQGGFREEDCIACAMHRGQTQ